VVLVEASGDPQVRYHRGTMHTLLFLDPGHFHAALTLRAPQARVADQVFVYAREGAELRDFLALIERFNRRSKHPTRWRPVVTTCDDPLGRLVDERRGDVVVLAGKNGGKARTIRRLHESGFHVLADKPWLVESADLEHVRASLAGWPLAAEIMTGRHDLTAKLVKRLVGVPAFFGDFRRDGAAIEQESEHCLEKLVDGAPLRRPWWFFDVRVQGSGPVDIPTHVVDQAQWLVDSDTATPALLSARAWSTRVPAEAFRRITGEEGFPRELQPFVDGDSLSYRCNAELVYQIGRITASAATRWNLSPSAGGGDASHNVVHGTRADIHLEQSARTGHRRRAFVEPRADAAEVVRALRDTIATWQAELPGVEVVPTGSDTYEVTVPPSLDGGHETHFPRVLDEFLSIVDDHRWPTALAERTLAKYALLAEAAAKTNAEDATLSARGEP
jgi:predicted dehydrogenase